MTIISPATTIDVGSNYVWDAAYISPTWPDNNDVADNYDSQSSIIIEQLSQMRANGQSTISIVLFPIDGWGDGGQSLENSAGGNFQPQQIKDLRDLFSEIGTLGFDSVLVRFAFQGASGYGAAPGSIDQIYDSELIANLTDEVFAPSGIPYLLDLDVEGLNPAYPPSWAAEFQAIWTTYTDQFGTANTVGLSTNHIWNQVGVQYMQQIYQGVYPAEFSIEFYTDGSMPTVYEQFISLYKALTAAGIDRPWVISETYYNDPVVAAELEQGIKDTGQPVTSIYQWGITTQPDSENYVLPLQGSAYSILNGITQAPQYFATSGVFDLSGSEVVAGGAGLLTIRSTTKDNIITGGSGGILYLESADGSANLITTAIDSTNTVSVVGWDRIVSNGTDIISTNGGNSDIIVNCTGNIGIGSGYNTIQINGAAYVEDGINQNFYIVSGTAILMGQGGSPDLSLGSSARATITGPLTQLTFNSTGGSLNLTTIESSCLVALSASGPITTGSIVSGTSHLTTGLGGLGAVLTITSGKANITSNGPDSIYCGQDTLNVIINDHAVVYASSSPLYVVGGGNTAEALLYGGNGTSTVSGSWADVTYYGGSYSNTAIYSSTNATFVGGSGRMTVLGGSNARIVGGLGGLVYSSDDDGEGNNITTSRLTKNLLILTGGDSISSNGNDIIQGGTGDSNFVLNGSALLYGSKGFSHITVNGTATLLGNGTDAVVVSAGANATVVAGISTTVKEINGSVEYSQVNGLTQSSVIISGGFASISGGQSQNLVVATSGGPPVSVVGGSGVLTVQSAGSDRILGGSGTLSVVSSGFGMQFIAGNGAASINLLEGGDTISFGLGRSSVFISAIGSGDLFNVPQIASNGFDIITGYRTDTDQLVLQGGVSISSSSIDTAGSHFMLSNNTQILLAGETILPPELGW